MIENANDVTIDQLESDLREARARLDKALAALREISDGRLQSVPNPLLAYVQVCELARAAIAEIEGS